MRIGLICFLIVFITACNFKAEKKINDKLYFDISGYFKREAIRLTNEKAIVKKSVFVNGKTEEKNIKITNWEQEFNSFTDADINKASWRGSFTLSKSDTLETYISQNKKIPVKKVEIAYKNGKVFFIKLFLTTTTNLYTSKDSLVYYPNSLYQIKKTQNIKLMNLKNYQIIGKFK